MQKIKKEETFAQILNGSEHAGNHAQLQKDINIPFEIDYSVFKKTAEEKANAAVVKSNWKHGKRI